MTGQRSGICCKPNETRRTRTTWNGLRAQAVEKRNVYGRDRFCCRGLITEGEYYAIKAELGVYGGLTKAHLERAGYILIGTRWTSYDEADAVSRDIEREAVPF